MVKHGREDALYRGAKSQGYAARSVFKLEEMDRRFRLLKKGAQVLDLGSHPGSWLQYACRKVGPQGLVVGVDIQPLAVELPANARFIQADLLELSAQDLLADGTGFDLVMSDAAPRTTGVAHADAARSLELAAKAVELARALLRPHGCLVAKLYAGQGMENVLKEIKMAFALGKTYRPQATTAGSKETYLLGRDFKAEHKKSQA